jgi:hypothetical protein
MGLSTGMNYTIPTTVLDNFFDDPLEVRRFALEQEFLPDINQSYPGKRSRPLHEISTPLFKHTINRFNSIFYVLNDIDGWQATAYFQLIDNTSAPWVHRDLQTISGIIYLNDNSDPATGTTIYKPKTTGLFGLDVTDKQILPEDARLANNSQFEESVVVKNKFNRLVAFDSKEFHAASSFDEIDEDQRLTLVFFIERLNVRHYPIQRVHLI